MGSIPDTLPNAESTGVEIEPSLEYAQRMDFEDPLQRFRSEFIIPSVSDLTRKTLAAIDGEAPSAEPCIYLCGNSLGLQPRRTRRRIDKFLSQWSTKAVTGHFFEYEDSDVQAFLHIDDAASRLMAPVVGAHESEVVVMGTLTTNLHLLMSSFYRPTKNRFKIILEGKAFPSDHFAVESQIVQNGFDPAEAMVVIHPKDNQFLLSTEHIIEVIDQHADTTALILLPGIQYYTGQYFDMATITRHAHARGILIGWDCAHAAGNVELRLHDWDVDFAVWCNYKYLNSGPGAIAAAFVHERHGKVDMNAKQPFRPRLTGWWGADKESRFLMGTGELTLGLCETMGTF